MESYYTASIDNNLSFEKLSEDVQADICIIGGGFTGISSALHLAKSGFKVAVLEAHQPG